MKKLLFFVLVCGVMSACKGERIYLEKDKIPLLNNNEILCFQDSANNSRVDTFSIDFRNIWHLDMESDYIQYIEIYYNKSNQKTPFFSIYLSPSGVGTLFFLTDYRTQSVKDIIDNFTVKGVRYSNVYIGHYNNTNNVDTIPNLVYYTYPNGIIRYEYKDGRVYNLVSK